MPPQMRGPLRARPNKQNEQASRRMFVSSARAWGPQPEVLASKFTCSCPPRQCRTG